jgi:hypothetical protein
MSRSQTSRPEGPRLLIPIRCRTGMLSGITGTFAKVPIARDAAIPVSRVRYPCVTHPSATEPPQYCYKEGPVRLACLSHAASVRSEPGSNSSVKFADRTASPGPLRARFRPPVDFDSTHTSPTDPPGWAGSENWHRRVAPGYPGRHPTFSRRSITHC